MVEIDVTDKIKQIDQLFIDFNEKDIHKNAKPPFVEDGIFDVKRWYSQDKDKRVMFIYKEAYIDKRVFHLRELIPDWIAKDKEVHYTMWHRTAQITYLLQNITKDWFPSLKDGRAHMNDAILSAAVINIKKSGGQTSSNLSDLKKYVDSDRDLLKKQIAIIDPAIIVLGGTKELVNKEVLDLGPVKDEDSSFYESDGRLIIDYSHPSYRVSNEMYYYTLAATYLQYLRGQHIKLDTP